MEDTKKCYYCEEVKPLSSFWNDSKKEDGKSIYCIECAKMKNRPKKRKKRSKEETKKAKKEYYEKNKVKILEKAKESYDPEKRKEYYENNREVILEKKKKYNGRYKEYKKEYNKKYREENKDYYSDYMKKWLMTEDGKLSKKMSYNKRRELSILHECSLTKDDFDAIIKNAIIISDNKCMKCGSETDLQLDHFYPLSKGFPLSKTNAILLCKSCNCSKKDKMPEDFFEENEFTKILKLLFN